MTTFQYILIALYALGIISTISLIDEPRKPYGVKTALFSIVIYLVLIYGIIHWI